MVVRVSVLDVVLVVQRVVKADVVEAAMDAKDVERNALADANQGVLLHVIHAQQHVRIHVMLDVL